MSVESSTEETSLTPRHIAVIMDGNGRWARQRGLNRLEGHRRGAQAVRKVVEESRRLGVRYLTLFSFSSENWRRSAEEVGGLMDLFRRYLESEIDTLLKNDVRLRAVGELERLPAGVRTVLARDMERTADRKGMDLILAVSYSGRDEIVAAAQRLAVDVEARRISAAEVDAEAFRSRLWAADVPDPDLLIRTSGEMRISNFYLWQLAYTEIVVVPELWPDFDEQVFRRCIAEYGTRERRFGLTSEQLRGASRNSPDGPEQGASG